MLAVLGVYLGILFGIAWVSLHPFRTPLFISPGHLGAPQEELEIPSTGGVVMKAWWVAGDCVAMPKTERGVSALDGRFDERTVVAILCHGYVMNRSELTPVAYWLWKRGMSSLLIEFRAHGKTRRGKSTIGWNEADDVLAAIEVARRRMPDARIVLIGSSMGSAACAFAAARGAKVDAIVLDSCYSKMINASFGWWRFLGGPLVSVFLGPVILFAGPLAGINPFRVDVARALRSVTCPVLLLHGREDNLATPSEAERNLAALGPLAEIAWFDNCGHSEFRWLQAERYYQELETFLIRCSLLDSPSAHEPSVREELTETRPSGR